MKISRRLLVAGLVAMAVTQHILPASAANTLSAPDAYSQAKTGKIVLIDIRRPDEWEETGSASVAKRLDMRRDDFLEALDQLLGGDRTKPVAVMCARGVRSGRLSRVMREAGYTNVIDVPEGMLGSGAGPGWLERGLPITK